MTISRLFFVKKHRLKKYKQKLDLRKGNDPNYLGLITENQKENSSCVKDNS